MMNPDDRPWCARSDPRMNRAVEARIRDPNLTLYQCLCIGGFEYTSDDAAEMDCENVTLCQRKNQLNRRLRSFRKRFGSIRSGQLIQTRRENPASAQTTFGLNTLERPFQSNTSTTNSEPTEERRSSVEAPLSVQDQQGLVNSLLDTWESITAGAMPTFSTWQQVSSTEDQRDFQGQPAAPRMSGSVLTHPPASITTPNLDVSRQYFAPTAVAGNNLNVPIQIPTIPTNTGAAISESFHSSAAALPSGATVSFPPRPPTGIYTITTSSGPIQTFASTRVASACNNASTQPPMAGSNLLASTMANQIHAALYAGAPIASTAAPRAAMLDTRQEYALHLFQREVTSLYERCMLNAGYRPEEIQLMSPTYRSFIASASQSEWDRTRACLNSNNDTDQQQSNISHH